MGSPPMNFVEGAISGGTFAANGVSIPADGLADCANATIGFRPEDCEVVERGNGKLDASVYTVEMTGDQSLVTLKSDGDSIVVKMPKDFEIAEGGDAAITFDKVHAYFFDTTTGERLRA